MKLVIFIILITSFQTLLAEESASTETSPVDPELQARRIEYPLNNRYKGGQNLIYDCFGKYYTCVNDESFANCKSKRSEREKLKEEAYRCAPLKKFKDKKECLEANYDVIEKVTLQRFCYPK